jgi:hypothetical protein
MKTLVARHADSGTHTELHFDDSAQSITVHNVQNVDAIIEQNKIDQNSPHRTIEGIGRLSARIPMLKLQEIWEKTRHMDRDDKQRFLRRWLNDSENRHYRTNGDII